MPVAEGSGTGTGGGLVKSDFGSAKRTVGHGCLNPALELGARNALLRSQNGRMLKVVMRTKDVFSWSTPSYEHSWCGTVRV